MNDHFARLLCALVIALGGPVTQAAPTIAIPLAAPSNLFEPGDEVNFDVRVAGLEGQPAIAARVTDYAGREVWSQVFEARGPEAGLTIGPGAMDNGYYELRINVGNGAGAPEAVASFGVAPFVERTAEEVREGGYRFGLKKWNWREPQHGTEWNEHDAVAASCRLGLQWTREMLQQKSHLGTIEMIGSYPMNVVMKIERFPAEFYDETRYGPVAAWEAEQGRGAWTLKTLPKKEPYQQWLREHIRQIPEGQKVFEIWNEPWDKMTPEDFAQICGWIAEVVYDERPDATLGPNLLGSTSVYDFDARFVSAGGMARMNMVALHPYGNTEDRAWLRDYCRWMNEQVGRDLEYYVTEFGSYSTPEGPSKRTEHEQARRVVRQALYLYAEGIRVFMPHTMGQSERNPTYHEEWYGLFRFSHQPKPAIIAYANAARIIDTSRYVGDVWLGPGVDAMLFERSGVYTLALGTRGESIQVDLDPGVEEVTAIDMVGRESRRRAVNGKLQVRATDDWTYLVGVSPALAAQASKDLRADRWPKPDRDPRNSRRLARMPSPPTFDGRLDEWQSATQIGMVNPKVNGADASGVGYLAWDADFLYVAVDMRDNQVFNPQARAKLYLGDSLEVFISTAPRDAGTGSAPTDHQLFVTPTSAEGEPMFTEVMDSPDTSVQEDVTDGHAHIGPGNEGWVAEVAIPWSRLSGFEAEAGGKLAVEVRVNDADSSHERFKIDPTDAQGINPLDPTKWSLHELVD